MIDGQTNTPLAGLPVFLSETNTQLTDKQGQFRFANLEAGDYTIHIGQADQMMVQTPLQRAQIIELGQIRFFPETGATAIQGTVTNATTNEPLAGVAILVTGVDDAIFTDTQGAYRIGNLEPGDVMIQASLEGYLTQSQMGTVSAGMTLVASLALSPDTVTLEGVVTSGSLEGVVLAGATILIDGTPSTQTAADGSYRVEGLSSGEHRIRIEYEGYDSVDAFVTMPAQTTLIFSPQLYLTGSTPPIEDNASVTGIVVDKTTGLPIEGVSVTNGTETVTTDSTGQFHLINLPPVPTTLSLQTMGYLDKTMMLTLSAFTQLDLGEIVLTPEGYLMQVGAKGVVMDASTNQVLADVSIQARFGDTEQSLASAADGTFDFTGQVEEELLGQLSFTIEGYVPFTLDVLLFENEILSLGQVRLRPEEVIVLLPDLVVEQVDNTGLQTAPQTHAISGSVTAQIKNAGTTPTDSNIALLAFYDVDLNGVYDTDIDVSLGEAVIENALAVSASVTVDIAVVGELPFRDAPIQVWVDNAQTVVESDEGNNLKTACLACGNDIDAVPPPSDEQPEKYYGYNAKAYNGYLTLVGFTDETTFSLRPLPSGTVISGTINKLQRSVLYLSNIRHFVLETSAPLLAVLHSRCCYPYTNTGTFFYPTLSGKSFYGTSFIITVLGIPGRGNVNYGHVVVFAQEEAVVTVRNVAGDIIATSPRLAKGSTWRLDKLPYYNNRSYILRHGYVYTVNSTGKIAIANTERNGYSQIPPVPDSQIPTQSLDDVGRIFYFPLVTWTGSGIAVLNPSSESAVFSVTNLETGARVIAEQSVTPNDIHYTDFPGNSGLGYYKLRVLEGQIMVWAGGTECYHTAADLGDDYSTNFGWEGKRFVIHTQTYGAYLFAGEDNTRVVINNGEPQLLNTDDFLNLAPQTKVTITADKPVTVQTVGGAGCYFLNDYATSLRPALRETIRSMDLSASRLQVSDNGFGQPFTLQVRIGNGGTFASSPGILVTFYSGNPAENGVKLGTVKLEILAPGTYQDIQLEGVEIVDFDQDIYAVVDAENRMTECNETNNSVSIPITAISSAHISATTDAPEYGPFTSVVIDYTVQNQGALPLALTLPAASVTAEVFITDVNGDTVATFPPQTVDTLAAGENQAFELNWNTGTVLTGDYKVHARLKNALGELVDEADSPFTIIKGEGPVLSLRTATDKPSYHTTDVVLINHLVQNLSLNTLVEDALLTLTITGPDGEIVHTANQALQQLSPNQAQELMMPFMLNQAALGDYTVVVTVTDPGHTELARQQTAFQVDNELNRAVTGKVLAHWALGNTGQRQACVETVTNFGTEFETGLAMEHLVMNLETLDIIDTYGTTLDLAPGSSQHFDFTVETLSLPPASYACVLQVQLDEQWQVLDFDTFTLTDTVGSECSTVYALHDEQVNDSQLFTYHLDDGALHPLGPLYLDYDLEGLDIDPYTHKLYASSGQGASRLYQVDGHTGALRPIGDIGFHDVESLSFHPDGSLWGWAKEGLVRINVDTGLGSLEYANNTNIEGLAWDNLGTALYGSAHKNNQRSTLFVYQNQTLTEACDNLPGGVESLEMGPDNQLVFGRHEPTSLSFHLYDAENCQMVTNAQINTHYHDIEAIAWPSANCTAQQRALRAFFLALSDEDVFIGADRMIRFSNDGQTHQGLLSEQVTQGLVPENGQLHLVAIFDANEDGIDDFLITYPDGLQQVLYYLGLTEPEN